MFLQNPAIPTSDSNKGRAKILVAPEIILHLLKLLNRGIVILPTHEHLAFMEDLIPEDARVIQYGPAQNNDICFLIESNELPAVSILEGAVPPALNLVVCQNGTKGKSPHQIRVEKFMANAGQEVPASPQLPDSETRKLRASLILEEALETIKALGYCVVCTNHGDLHFDGLGPGNSEFRDYYISRSTHESVPIEPDLEEIADGCADTIVVSTGTLSACGICDVALQVEVDRSNLAKFGEGAYRREDGKWIKPANWQPPQIKEILERQSRAE